MVDLYPLEVTDTPMPPPPPPPGPTPTTTTPTPILTVAGITEGIDVLAFTGFDPIISLSGGSVVIAGIAILVASLRRRYANKKQG